MKKLQLDELNRKSVDEFRQTEKIPVVVILDNIRSMMNVGSVFRTADAFLIEKIWLCGITGQPPHREITKTALGATESVNWEYAPQTTELVKKLKQEGYLIAGVEQTDSSVSLTDFSPDKNKKYALVLGNEVEGISQEILPLLDVCIEIPQEGTKHSLNVSVAAGIVIFQMYKSLR
jgi:23S rRNA (guanosine2251-2'-O)-methyltransferase